MARERVGDEGALSGGLDGAFDRGDDDGSDALQHLQDGSDELQESAMLPSNGARLATHGNGLAVASLGAMRTGGMRKGKGKVPKDSNKPTDPPARGFYTSIYDLIHVSMTVWVGAALMVFGATLVLIKRFYNPPSVLVLVPPLAALCTQAPISRALTGSLLMHTSHMHTSHMHTSHMHTSHMHTSHMHTC